MKTATGLVEYAKAQLGKPYWYGTYGNISTKSLYESKKKQYPSFYEWSLPSDQLNKRVHDCVGLIKGYLWSETPTSAPKYNAAQDVSANGMLAKCTTHGAIKTMPDKPGTLVFMRGHVGVYIGDGYVIEAKGHKYGVVKTKLKGRGWINWGWCPWIVYESEQPKDIAKIAQEVINGKWGNGEERRKKLEAAGYNYIDVQKKVNEILNGGTAYYPRYTGTSNSIVDALYAVGADPSYKHREKIANANGITSYKGTPNQNVKLLNLLKAGKLVKE
jgi:uncharacterized protein (UPF0297 family)